jgi:hypothetical protein
LNSEIAKEFAESAFINAAHVVSAWKLRFVLVNENLKYETTRIYLDYSATTLVDPRVAAK